VRRIASGVVIAFDSARGTGEVSNDAGGTLGFHCTAVADGSRTIAVGTPVHFRTVPGHAGRYEATELTALGEPLESDDSER
jgi:cold shock CspA family protein